MSSKYVRDTFTAFLVAQNPTEKVIDISAESDNLQDFLTLKGVKPSDNWVGILFIGAEESPVSIVADGTQGKYRETGVVEINVVAKARLGIGAAIISRADVIVNTLRGRRIGDIIIEGIVPPNFGTGGSIDFEAGMTSAIILISYKRDLSL